MAKTKAEKEGWKPKDRESVEDVLIPEVVDDPVEAIKSLKPVDGLNFDAFINDLSANMQDVKKYSSVMSGWFGRMKMNRQVRHIALFEQYLNKVREASNTAAELQATLLKNKIIFHFQAQIAAQRVKEEWAVEQTGRKLQMATMEADIAHLEFKKRFFETVDPNTLSDTALMLLNMLQPMSARINNFVQTGDSVVSTSKDVKFGSIEEMYRIQKGQGNQDQQNRLMEILMQQLMAGVGEKEARVKKTLAEASQEESKAADMEWKHEKKKKRDEI